MIAFYSQQVSSGTWDGRSNYWGNNGSTSSSGNIYAQVWPGREQDLRRLAEA